MGKYEPEMGQAIFGQPHSEYECPEFIHAGLTRLAEEMARVERNITQQEYESPTSNSGAIYETDAFSMHAYYWGDCTCGAQQPQHTDECQRGNQSRWMEWRDARSEKCKCNVEATEDGEFYELDAVLCEQFAKDNPEPQWKCVCGAADGWVERDECDVTCRTMQPNFKCGDFEVRWYKYLGRGMSMNRVVDANEFFELIDKCLASVHDKERLYFADDPDMQPY